MSAVGGKPELVNVRPKPPKETTLNQRVFGFSKFDQYRELTTDP
jgi:hypothetical protein